MTTATAIAQLEGDGLRFVATTGSGHTVAMDTAEGGSGPRPSELLLVAQAGCTAMDVASILRKKRQRFTRYEVRVAGEQREDPPPHIFERIRIVHVIDGEVELEAVRRAIELSATKYCTVTGNLASGAAEVEHAYLVRTPDGDEHYKAVAITGPGMAASVQPPPAPIDPVGAGAPRPLRAGRPASPGGSALATRGTTNR